MSKEKRRVPKLRFPGFTEDWEQRKLGEVVKSYSGGTPTASNKEYYGGDIPFIRSAEINSDTTELYITQKGLDNSSAKIVEKGTILYAMYGATSGEVGISKINGAINQAILAMIPLEYNGKIIAQYLRKNKESIIGKYLQGGQGNLSANIILELPIQLPGLEESNQIANFLESFDNIITIHQRKLDNLKLKKKALLQKLFPKNGERYPELRFPGFTDAWEQRKVNEIFKVTRGQVLAASLTTPEKNRGNIYPVYSSQTKDNGLLGYYSEYLFENAITWTTDGANAGTVNFRPGRFYSTNVNGVLINENGYACYAVSEIINKVAYKYVSKVGNPKLMNNVMAEINIMITPNIDELKQISKLIEAYNQYITLHQRKLDHLQLQKKALLQQMFV